MTSGCVFMMQISLTALQRLRIIAQHSDISLLDGETPNPF